jgi:hypothetical protein
MAATRNNARDTPSGLLKLWKRRKRTNALVDRDGI